MVDNCRNCEWTWEKAFYIMGPRQGSIVDIMWVWVRMRACGGRRVLQCIYIYNSYSLCIIFENPSDCKKECWVRLFFLHFHVFHVGQKEWRAQSQLFWFCWQPCVTNTISFWGDLYINCLCNGWLILWAGLESQRPFFLLVCWECSLRSAPRSPKQPKPRVYHLRKVFYHVYT